MRRLLFAAGTVVLTAFFAYGTMRALRPEQYPGQATVADLFSDVDRALLHLDFGGACMFAGCPSIKGMWLDGIVVDLTLLAGGVAFAVAFGVLGGLWCASRRRTRSARALEGFATLLDCTPVYVVGLGVLRARAPVRPGRPAVLLRPDSYAPPLENPWDYVRSMWLPWSWSARRSGPRSAPHGDAGRRDMGEETSARRPRRGSRTRRSCAATRGRRPTCRSPRWSAPRRRSRS